MGNRRMSNPFNVENQLNISFATISVRFCNSDAFITLNVPKHRGLWPAIMLLLHDTDFQVLNATFSATSSNTDFHCIHAQIPDDSNIDSEELHCMFEALILEQIGIRASRA